MSTGKGIISSNDLMRRLVQSKKVMDKVETGEYETGNVNEEILRSNPEDLINNNTIQNVSSRPVGVPNLDKINNSKLPDVIKKAMIDNPIPQISLSESLDMDFVKGARKLMEREGLISKTPKKQTQTRQEGLTTESIDMNTITVLIENTIRKVLDEKLNQILTAQQTTSINESLVLKVGDSIFKGKITGVNKSK